MSGATLVTGGTGMLGRALQEILPGARYLGSKDGDLTDRRRVDELFAEARPETVIHLAARIGGVKKNALHNAELFTENVLINTHVLEAARRHGAKRLVSVLSACAFSHEPGRDSTTEDLHAGLPYAGNLGYAFAKRALDVQTRIMRSQYGCAFSTITPVTMYGPHDDFDLDGGHVVASLLRKALDAKSHGGPLRIWGSGRAVRQFVYVGDVARALAALLDKDYAGDTLVIAPDDGITIRGLAETVARAAGFSGEIVYDVSQPEGEPRRVLEHGAFGRVFPRFRFTPLEDGLRATAQWLAQALPG